MKKITPEDLNLSIRKVESTSETLNSPRLGETVQGDCESVDACDTKYGNCMTRKYTNCSSCPETEKCYETFECQTQDCNDTQSSGVICCDKTHGADCLVTFGCMTMKCEALTSDDSCNTSRLCYLTMNNCKETNQLDCGAANFQTE